MELNNVNLDIAHLNVMDIENHDEPVPELFFFDQVFDDVLDLEEERAAQEREDAALADLLWDNDDDDDEASEPDDGYFTDSDVDNNIDDMDINIGDIVQVVPVPDPNDAEEVEEDVPQPADVDSDAETLENVQDIDARDIDYDPTMDLDSDDDDDDDDSDEDEVNDVEEVVKCEVAIRQLLKVRKLYFDSAKKLLNLKIQKEEKKIRTRLARVQRRVRRNRHRINDVPRRRYDMCFGCAKPFWLQRTRCWVRCTMCGDWLCPDCNEEPLHCQDERGLFQQ